MAFGNNTVWDVRSTGSDTANGGGFDPGNASMATDLAATVATSSAPVCTSASYNFVAGDVGAWLFIQAGTNWTPGWYQIASVASNAATLTATIGTGVLATFVGSQTIWGGMSTAAGCATTASPTGGTWSVDYSQQNSPQIAFTDMVIDGTTNTKFTSAAHPVGKNMIGNIISVTAGTGFSVQRVQIVSTVTTTATCDKSLGTLSSTGGTGGLGGCLATPGNAGLLHSTGSMTIAVKQAAYTFSATQNIAGGGVKLATGGAGSPTTIFSWNTNRWPYNTDATRAVISPGANSTTLFQTQQDGVITNFDCQNAGVFTSCIGYQLGGGGGRSLCWNCKSNGIASAFLGSGTSTFYYCEAVNAPTQSFNCTGGQNMMLGCVARGGSNQINMTGNNNFASHCASLSPVSGAHGWVVTQLSALESCIAYSTTGANTDGFSGITQTMFLVNCVATDCVRYGFDGGGTPPFSDQKLINCAGYNNGTSNVHGTMYAIGVNLHNFIACSASPWNNPGSLDFTLNSTAGGGAALKAAGYPGSYPGLTGTSAPDVGLFQAAASGSTNIFAMEG